MVELISSIMISSRTQNPPKLKPLLIFDGDCGFCRYWLVKWKKVSKEKFDFEPYQKVASNYTDIPLDQFQKAVQLILQNGQVMQGAEVAYYTYYINGSFPMLYTLYKSNRFFRSLSDALYRWVAANRNFAFRLTKLLFGKDPYQSSLIRPVIFMLLLLTILVFLNRAST